MTPRGLTARSAPYYTCVALIFFTGMTGLRWGQCRTLESQMSQATAVSDRNVALVTGPAPRRSRRESIEPNREYCTQLAARWKENRDPKHGGQLYRLKILSLPEEGPSRTVFPEQTLFRYVRHVYRCCQQGFHCRSVKGIQGQMRGDTNVEFLLASDVLSVLVVRAEIHLKVANPLNLRVEPWIPSMANHPHRTRYTVWSGDGTVDLRVDLLFLFQGLQEAFGSVQRGPSLAGLRRVGGLARHKAAGPRGSQVSPHSQHTDSDMWEGGDRPPTYDLELSLVLQCSRDRGSAEVSCDNNGVRLLHTPFIAISYR